MSNDTNDGVTPYLPTSVEHKEEDGTFWCECPKCAFPYQYDDPKVSVVGRLPACEACRRRYEVVSG